MPASPRLLWHRLFGIALVEQFVGTPWRVELELELALRSQRLDIVLNARPARRPARRRACLTDSTTCAHIICSPTKSVRESLTAWSFPTWPTRCRTSFATRIGCLSKI
ncbi:hypothetical protein EDC35_102207 [Thiobaca trueperi]|uniref:Uncharacterized protein n=1 Tax=Thiobaca trueperi TaxID=127458 RepID=A0A4R3N4A9_9GAMM|nr:hypothetical protein EDC35_102207 [Thiobaca trueperi]